MANTVTFWYRKGFYYHSHIKYYRGPHLTLIGTTTRTLDFVSYHIIRLIHGEEKLREMASKVH